MLRVQATRDAVKSMEPTRATWRLRLRGVPIAMNSAIPQFDPDVDVVTLFGTIIRLNMAEISKNAVLDSMTIHIVVPGERCSLSCNLKTAATIRRCALESQSEHALRH